MDYQKNLPGETIYDREADPAPRTEPVQEPEAETEAPAAEAAEAAENAPAQEGQRQSPAGEEKKPDLRHQFAIASLLTGVGSFVILFAVPLFGVAIAAVGGVMGIVFGVIGRKSSKGLAWTGIIFSIVTLVLVLICLILLCIAGWHLMLQLFYEWSDGLSTIPRGYYGEFGDFPRGFDFDLDFDRGSFYLD